MNVYVPENLTDKERESLKQMKALPILPRRKRNKSGRSTDSNGCSIKENAIWMNVLVTTCYIARKSQSLLARA